MNNFKVVDFRFASKDDAYEERFVLPNMWSRPYEYKYVYDFINGVKHKDLSVPKIHNSSWGFEGVHVTFRDMLDEIGECVHSDIVESKFRDTFYYDITTENKDFENKFDFVVNVSTIEHIPNKEDRIKAIESLFKQVKVNGYLILTFDYPRVNLDEIQKLINYECESVKNKLNGNNSIVENKTYDGLNIVYLIIKKTK